MSAADAEPPPPTPHHLRLMARACGRLRHPHLTATTRDEWWRMARPRIGGPANQRRLSSCASTARIGATHSGVWPTIPRHGARSMRASSTDSHWAVVDWLTQSGNDSRRNRCPTDRTDIYSAEHRPGCVANGKRHAAVGPAARPDRSRRQRVRQGLAQPPQTVAKAQPLSRSIGRASPERGASPIAQVPPVMRPLARRRFAHRAWSRLEQR